MDLLDHTFMKQALELAAKGRGRTSPNPMVGAVVVRKGEIIGRGYHRKAGTPHAEIHALNDAGMAARGSTLYVTLEPCCHRGRTLPCADFIIRSRVARVVVAMLDPNPLVNGKGVQKLREAGIRVEVGLLEREARELNTFFIKYISTKTPYVILKAAVTLDGRIATRTGASRWITGEPARRRGHEIRDRVDAILVGVNTVLTDNPGLTTRLPGEEGKDPVRIILDTHLRTPLNAKVIVNESAAPTYIFAGSDVAPERVRAYQEKNVTVMVARKGTGGISFGQVLEDLGRMEFSSLLIEGGATIHAAALREGVVDHLLFFIAPKIMGGGESREAIGDIGIERMEDVIRLRNVRTEKVGEDLLMEGDLRPSVSDPPFRAVGLETEKSERI
ncbi:MAG: bifunctional diaminohydroxyphosphoribosylaminopyrimidine deaminase/5-amino-6-(5-phosphoribosylamino)uracil reductase RibD [Deltaproteobacteria bacterium]|nr:bifunctional diaminohydroxyphosphoribosylaminopyrimidine deaminase/5-amino-6-(5-phosphoribosylamino)uracil reductase RibD [Deltaproteobacteria bacterium]